MADTYIDRIKTYKLEEIITDKASKTISEIEALARTAPKLRSFSAALCAGTAQRFGLIAEIKKASPSKGVIRDDFDPAALALSYEAGGARCLSVLTDKRSFGGDKNDLRKARAACSLPVLRKDFIIDPYQVAQARALGADCVLLIMAALEDSQAQELEQTAFDWGMEVILEVHDEIELERACTLKSNLIGINNRDLRTFETNLDVSRRLAKITPSDRLIISESGLSSFEQLTELSHHNIRNFLIGESLMRQADVTKAVRALLKTGETTPNDTCESL